MSVSHLFFDIGGVLGTNAWSSPQRRRAIERFELEPAEFEQQHRDAVGTFEQGRMTLDEYLDATVFYRERGFSREAFVEFMLAESRPDEVTIALARQLGDSGKYRILLLARFHQAVTPDLPGGARHLTGAPGTCRVHR